AQLFWSKWDFAEARDMTLSLAFAYAAALLGSMLIYRIFFHPLRHFRGPFMASVSKFWNVAHVSRSKNYRLMEDMRRSYGDFVRTGVFCILCGFAEMDLSCGIENDCVQGPNEVTLFAPEAVRALDGAGTKCTKAVWYDILLPTVSLVTTRDQSLHNERRRIWEQAFRPRALQDYERRHNHFAIQLQESIKKFGGAPINVSRLFYLYTFDVMSDLVFGEPLDMLVDDRNHFAVDLLQDGMDLLGPLSPTPWLVRIGLSVPGIAQDFKSLLSWSAKKLEHRMQLTKLRSEVAEASSPFDSGALKSMAHLNGVINEALRLHPSLPSSGLRHTPKEGIIVAGQYIPGNVTVSAPRFSLGRREFLTINPAKLLKNSS
ncbi:MAG: hypothetical protein Q9174_004766, partial [Haloplaca sp. 1 TL-2023]